MNAGPVSITDHYPNWKIHGTWPCGHTAAIDLGRFMAWGMADVPMKALCIRLQCPVCGAKGPARIQAGWVGRDELLVGEIAAERKEKVRELRPASNIPKNIP